MELSWRRRGKGAPLLLLMGMSGHSAHWGEPFLAALEQEGFELLLVDNRATGDSPDDGAPFTVADMAADALAVLDAAEWPKAHVLGISMGGMVAQELVLAHPERVDHLVLGCTFAGGSTAIPTPRSTAEKLQAAWSSGDREQALRAMWEVNVSSTFAEDAQAFSQFRRTAADRPVPLEVIGRQLQAIQQHDTLDRLRELQVRTLVLHGEEDQMLPVENGRLIAEAIPGADVDVLEATGHLFFVEQPDRAAGEVASFALER